MSLQAQVNWEWGCKGHNICEQIWERGKFAHFPNFFFKCLYLWNHNSYELQAWYEYSSIILLHTLQIASPTHFLYGRSERSKNAILWPSLAAHHLGQQASFSFNIGSVKYKAQTANNQVWSLGLLLAWNGGRLKSDKKSWSYPFLKLTHIILSLYLLQCNVRINTVMDSYHKPYTWKYVMSMWNNMSGSLYLIIESVDSISRDGPDTPIYVIH